MPLYVLLIIASATLAASAVTYFFARTKLFSCMLILFYASCTLLSFLLFHTHQTVLFYVIVAIFVILPIACLTLFAVDMYFAVFCTDTSFVFVLVWLLIPMFFIINLIGYLARVIRD
ncbi:MAG: hypothetical protein HRF42_09350 [Candidatus Brocadia sp.]